MYSIEEYDNNKTKVLKYILYKKRTESEIRTKFKDTIEEKMLEEIIEELKEKAYIDDKEYIKRAINNFKILKSLSKQELKYKLLAKGINKNMLEDYFYENNDELTEYEINSAKKIIQKKQNLEKTEITNYLLKKGYKKDNIEEAFEAFT